MAENVWVPLVGVVLAVVIPMRLASVMWAWLQGASEL